MEQLIKNKIIELQNEIEKLKEENKEIGKMNEENIGLKDKNIKLEEQNRELKEKITKIETYMKKALKTNKWKKDDCGPELSISENGLEATHLDPERVNLVRAFVPIPINNLGNKPRIFFYFEVQILGKPGWLYPISIGFCDQHFPLQYNWLDWEKNLNSIGFFSNGGIAIDGDFIAFGNDDVFFKKEDFVGIGIIKHSNFKMECFVTWNVKLQGKGELPAKFANIELFPAINLSFPGDSIRVNFGKDKWQFKEFEWVLQ